MEGFKGAEKGQLAFFILFAAALLAVFVVFIVLFMAGVNQWLCIGFIVSASLLLVWQTFRLNAKYGTHADESRRTQTASTLHYQPKGDTPIFTYKKRKEERP